MMSAGGFSSEQQGERVDKDRLACAGLSGEQVEAGTELDGGAIDHSIVFCAQLQQHSSPRWRRPEPVRGRCDKARITKAGVARPGHPGGYAADAGAAVQQVHWSQTPMPLPFALALLLFQDDAAAAPPVASNSSALAEMIHNSGPVAFTVLVILLIASIFSWTIMISKWTYFRRAQLQGTRFRPGFPEVGAAERDCGGGVAVQAQPAGGRVYGDP